MGLGSWAAKACDYPVSPQPPHILSEDSFSITSIYKNDPPVPWESSERKSTIFQEVFWGAMVDSAGTLEIFHVGGKIQLKGVIQASARQEHTGGRSLDIAPSPFFVCFLLSSYDFLWLTYSLEQAKFRFTFFL